ncbi:MAG: hypothetical protein ACI9JY_001904, partial [Saprospiraceae bacterium]
KKRKSKLELKSKGVNYLFLIPKLDFTTFFNN